MRRTVLAFVLTLLATSSVAGCLDRAAPAAEASRAPLPLDPLGPEERLRAVDAALSDAAVREALAEGRSRIVAVFLHADKARILAGDAARLADVQIYRYASDDVALVVVDLARGAMESLAFARFQPRLTFEEIVEAKGIVFADPAVRARFPDASRVDIRARLTVVDEAGHACAAHRCVEAVFFVDGLQSEAAPVLVDVSARRLVAPPSYGLPEVI